MGYVDLDGEIVKAYIQTSDYPYTVHTVLDPEELGRVVKTYSGDSFDCKFFNLVSNEYGIGLDSVSNVDSLTGLSTLQFENRAISISDNVKATFDQEE